jgi:hypothetical protein
MIMKYRFTLLLFTVVYGIAAQQLLSPKAFLGYDLGERFTRHHRVVEYFQHVAQASNRVKFFTYGHTYEHRPLVYVVVTAPENHEQLEQIRLDNLRRAGMAEGAPATNVAIVWLSYNVHGNEASSMEAAMLTLYELANPANTETGAWLKNTVVIMDPCVNPDGRDRYANFYNQYGNRIPNPGIEAKEHREPWPGGRSNHYWFDLNRDWAWLTQIESQQRIKIYHAWMPHVHVDFHEQGYNNPYYFAPAAEPYHEVISPWQRQFQQIIGKNHAKYFDQQGWLYFTRERFDLYYPSYGDTYPTYNGAIGMTYEQAGGGIAGLTITTREGDPLTLKDRLTHHHVTGLSTVEITAQHAGRVLAEFEKYFRENLTNPASPYKTYVITAANHPDKVARLTRLLDAHQIKYGLAGVTKTSRGFDYTTRNVKPVTVAAEDVLISIYQPKSRLITTLFEPTSRLADSVTYDITAWNLFYAYGLKGYALNEKLVPQRPYNPAPPVAAGAEKPYAYLFPWQSVNDARFLCALMKEGFRVRSALGAFKVDNTQFAPGTLIVTRRNNEHITDFDNRIRSLARDFGRTLFGASTGLVDEGSDFGSSAMAFLKAPRVAMLVGEQTSSLSAGAIWHFFEQELHYPLTQIGTDYFRSVNLQQYDVLVVPDGRYYLFNDETLKAVADWVAAGGKLIVTGNALEAFADKNGFALKRYATEEARKEAEKKQQQELQKHALTRYSEAERKEISELISGAIYPVLIDPSHPLAFGLGETYYTLKTNELLYPYLQGGWNAGVLKGKSKPVQGFAGFKINSLMEDRLVFGMQEKGRGSVVYFVDDPLFRNFWENGKMLFCNAVFVAGN